MSTSPACLYCYTKALYSRCQAFFSLGVLLVLACDKGGCLDFGAWLAEQRHGARMTQRDLANKCGVTPAYIAHLENGASEPPPVKTCKALARALRVGWEEVWQRAFAARLRRWLKREGYGRIPEPELLEIAKRIEAATR
jgi:transcriptional regulator with XRE-family HTH domain